VTIPVVMCLQSAELFTWCALKTYVRVAFSRRGRTPTRSSVAWTPSKCFHISKAAQNVNCRSWRPRLSADSLCAWLITSSRRSSWQDRRGESVPARHQICWMPQRGYRSRPASSSTLVHSTRTYSASLQNTLGRLRSDVTGRERLEQCGRDAGSR